MDFAKSLDGRRITVGDRVACALREGNRAALRLGEVTNITWAPEPNVENSSDTPDEFVLTVFWTHSSNDFLPKKPTRISARKTILISTENS